jgi:hypothetical protein
VFALVIGVLVAAQCAMGQAFERLVQAHLRDTVDDSALLEDLGAVFADGITGALVVSGTAYTGSLVGTVWKTTTRPLVELPLDLKHYAMNIARVPIAHDFAVIVWACAIKTGVHSASKVGAAVIVKSRAADARTTCAFQTAPAPRAPEATGAAIGIPTPDVKESVNRR